MRSAGNSPTWTPAGGAPVAEGRAALIGGTGTCLWAAPSTDRLVRIRPGAANGPPVRLGGAFLSSETSVAIATRTAWAVAPLEQTLVKVPLPAC